MRVWIATAGLMLCASVAHGAELKVISFPPLRAALSEEIPRFEGATGDKVAVTYATPAQLTDDLLREADLVIATEPVIAGLRLERKVAETDKEIARIGMAVFVRTGAPKPDVSTVEALKRTLIAAKSIAYIDPATGAPGGKYLAMLFKKLGIAGALAPKTKLLGPSGAEKAVAAGQVEIGLSQKTVILASPGVQLAGPLPSEVQNYLRFAAVVTIRSKNSESAKGFIQFLTQSREQLRVKGYD